MKKIVLSALAILGASAMIAPAQAQVTITGSGSPASITGAAVISGNGLTSAIAGEVVYPTGVYAEGLEVSIPYTIDASDPANPIVLETGVIPLQEYGDEDGVLTGYFPTLEISPLIIDDGGTPNDLTDDTTKYGIIVNPAGVGSVEGAVANLINDGILTWNDANNDGVQDDGELTYTGLTLAEKNSVIRSWQSGGLE